MSVIPAYLSRSVAGSYDNEAISITLLVWSCYFWIKSCKTGSYLLSICCALTYSYLVASWGGYSFIIAFIPFYVLSLLILKKFNYKIYICYTIFYIIGNLYSINTKFVEFKIFHKSEHLLSHLTILLINCKLLYDILDANLSKKQFKILTNYSITVLTCGTITFVVYLAFMGKTRFSERILTILDPSYAKNYIPIIASVSEHQPTNWATFFFDLHFAFLFTPLGIYYVLKDRSREGIFVCLYFVATVYFAGVMVRLILVLAPAMCVLSGIGISCLL